jgi:hypothetical protein
MYKGEPLWHSGENKRKSKDPGFAPHQSGQSGLKNICEIYRTPHGTEIYGAGCHFNVGISMYGAIFQSDQIWRNFAIWAIFFWRWAHFFLKNNKTSPKIYLNRL